VRHHHVGHHERDLAAAALQDLAGAALPSARGKKISTDVPRPGLLNTSMKAPFCFTAPYTTARPSPVP
jgi:hypothetical protein